MKLKYISIKQPVGDFYLTALDASILVKIVESVSRKDDSSYGVQRELDSKRVNEIKQYCSDPDATFPTPIIIAVNQSANVNIDERYIYINDDDSIIGQVIDGQHRIEGLKKSSYINDFQLPVIFMFDLEIYQKAYIFSIINGKQTKINMSLIYDLFSLNDTRSPYKTCHELARAINKDKSSPFYRRLKMLGKKEKGNDEASLSQSTFIKYLLELISKNPDEDSRNIKRNNKLIDDDKYPLRKYFISGNDDVIYKILFNLFSAVKEVFPYEWNNHKEYILSKPIGFGAILKIFPTLYEVAEIRGSMTKELFVDIFSVIKENMILQNKEFTSKYYGSNEQARTSLARDLLYNFNVGNFF